MTESVDVAERTLQQFQADYTFDVWSVGTIFFVLAAGQSFHVSNRDLMSTTNMLLEIKQEWVDQDERLVALDDAMERDFILQCLRVNPWERPSVDMLLQRPYLTPATTAALTATLPSSVEED